ncbi:hypothetical protein A33Q_4420 [Indibacter alkaliphilus LW1]|jgi:hypothetical protein|uniref:Uncharacterized protein n=1 Tax=Indibacter alkaliphilus (strain CCUG 57479 / KCTC 22604 / LW1) TaxID=1189612 RepID=S2CYU3_INDAL|nr:hypothetical protein [Indibacter alkaliphilus]EOZ92327.1 hypothetical protein A33Q_4420 [Indibacter alkaliphilus LW1]
MMKKQILTLAVAMLLSGSLAAQELFTGVGAKGYYNKTLKGQDAFYIPQFQIGFETYSETAQVVQEGKLSKLQNTFEAHSKGGQYAGGQKGSAKVTTILDAGLSLEDFQALANDFQSILENEIEKSGFRVLKMSEVDQLESFGKIKEKFDGKTDKKQGKASSDDIGAGTVKVMPDHTIFMFDEKSLMKGGGPAFYGMIKKAHKETNATMILQNINVDFSTVELDVELDAGRRGKTTSAEMKVLPKMRISYNTFDFIGPKGGPNSAPASMSSEFVSNKEYKANIYSDKAKAESLFSKWFSLKSRPDVDFDPRIVEISREDYMAAARDLFTQYSQAFANTLVVGARGK